MNKPKHVPDAIVQRIKDHVARSLPCVVDPALLDQSKGKAGDFVPVPSELIIAHVQSRRRVGASEAELDKEIQFLMQVFEQAAGNVHK